MICASMEPASGQAGGSVAPLLNCSNVSSPGTGMLSSSEGSQTWRTTEVSVLADIRSSAKAESTHSVLAPECARMKRASSALSMKLIGTSTAPSRATASVMVAPMPAAAPLMAAITGFLQARMARATRPPVSRTLLTICGSS